MLRNGSGQFPSQPERDESYVPETLAFTSEWKSFHSMAFDRIGLRKSRSFLTGKPVMRSTQENDKTVASRINSSFPCASSELGTRFPTGRFPSIPKQDVPSSGTD
jgi:hypothetical protein